MIVTGYGVCLVVSVVAALVMALRSYDHIDSYDWSMSLLLPFLVIIYWVKTQVSSPESALVLITVIQFGTSLLLAVLLFSMLRGIGIRPRIWLKAIVYGAVAALFFPAWQIFHSGDYASVISVIDTGDGFDSRLKGGFVAFRHYACLLAVVVLLVCVIAFLFSRKKTYSRRSVAGYLAFVAVWLALYAMEAFLNFDFSGLPFLYVLAQLFIILTYDQVHAHDIASLIRDSEGSRSARGHVAVGLSGTFLSADETALGFFPDLRTQRTDSRFREDSETGRRFLHMIDNYIGHGVDSGFLPSGNRTLAYELTGFSVRRSGATRGYLVGIRDATEEKKTRDKLRNFNSRLNREVAEKTRNIEAIQEKLVLSMADMVENRDGNTGGHVRRTSDIVAILVRTIREKAFFPLEESLARDIVRTAPMHDLGKVSIDSGILNKPGRLTPEEYAVMKTHSTISGQMVKILLEGVEEEALVRTAYRLARHHHERWDGKGYPDGLVGEMIPLEARIMAVADVYDALVSKRVYKEPMSYEKAARIMCEGMGTQFDPNMRLVFLSCRKELEAYYSAVQ